MDDTLKLLDALKREEQISWGRVPGSHLDPGVARAVEDARQRFHRFEPWVAEHFGGDGVIESPIHKIEDGLWVKRDDLLPISGSIKARGGIHEVFRLAETYPGEKPKLVVCSTGNLGLSIGTVGPLLGFRTEVHMSADAKSWKKQRLREHGATVIEHDAQFSEVIGRARLAAHTDGALFIDDENSLGLFAGYAVAAARLREQLDVEGIDVSDEHPLHVYVPCGVGGGPGGVTFGLKRAFGSAVRCHFVEPTGAPAMALGQVTGREAEVSCVDYGISGRTLADGLAVQRPSPLVCAHATHLVNSFHTMTDKTILCSVARLHSYLGSVVEPSAAATLFGPARLLNPSGTHLLWLTGGSLVPRTEQDELLAQAQSVAAEFEADPITYSFE